MKIGKETPTGPQREHFAGTAFGTTPTDPHKSADDLDQLSAVTPGRLSRPGVSRSGAPADGRRRPDGEGRV